MIGLEEKWSRNMKLYPRKCKECGVSGGKLGGCFAHTLIRNGKAESDYYHLACFNKAKQSA
jgi:hypothetical protein